MNDMTTTQQIELTVSTAEVGQGSPDEALYCLLLGGKPEDAQHLRDMLSNVQGATFSLRHVAEPSAGLDRLVEGDIDVILLDLSPPASIGIEMVTDLQANAPEVPILVLTGSGDEEVALRAISKGAQDYLLKETMHPRMLSRVMRYSIERKRSEKALRDSAQQWQTTFDAIIDAVNLVDLDGKIRQCNKAMPALLGRPSSEITGHTYWEFVHGAGESLVGTPVASMLESHHSERVTVEVGDRWLAVVAHPVPDERGNLIGGVQVISDITEQVRAERALKEYSERLEQMVEERTEELRAAQEQLLRRERLATLGQLAGTIAHEVRNPLGAMNNSVYYLRMRLGEQDPKVTKHLNIVSREIAAANNIISDIVNFVQGREPITAVVEPNALVERALERALVPEAVQVHADLAEYLPDVRVDGQQIEQVFLNLVNNAVDAMPDGGDLRIRTDLRNGHVEFVFSDTGVGIPLENQAQLFTPLFTTKVKGMGLGLSIVKRLVEAHRGEITVSSTVGEGSDFTVRLPHEAPQYGEELL